MTSKEFVIWLNGFVEACHEYAPTPKQWDALKDKLAEVDDSIPLGGLISDHNTFRINEVLPRWQEPHKVNPFYVGDVPLTNPLGSSGTGTANGVITTTPGGGSITIAKPQFVTSTATSLPEGTTVNYTTNKPHNED
jgi:hypothetical protein